MPALTITTAATTAATTLGPLFVKHGLPVLAKLVKSKLPGAASDVIDDVGTALGVDPDPQKIADVIKADPDNSSLILNQLQDTNMKHYAEMLSYELGMVQSVNETMRAEGKSKWALQALWRPIFGIGFTAVYIIIGFGIAYDIFVGDSSLPENTTLIIGYVGIGAPVLGVQVWKRSEDKKLGVA